LLPGVLRGIGLGSDLLVERRFGNLEVRAVAHQDDSQRTCAAQVAVNLPEGMAAARVIVKRLGSRRAEEPVRVERRSKRVIPEPSTVPAELPAQAPAPGLARVDRERAVVLHAKARFRHDIHDPAKPIAVFRGKRASHHVRAFDDVRTEASREHRMRVFPERDAVQERVQGHFVPANMHEVIMPANHPGRRGDDGLWKIDPLRERKRIDPLCGQDGRARRVCARKRDFATHVDVHLDAAELECHRERSDLTRFEHDTHFVCSEAIVRTRKDVFARPEVFEHEPPLRVGGRRLRISGGNGLQTNDAPRKRRPVLSRNHLPAKDGFTLCPKRACLDEERENQPDEHSPDDQRAASVHASHTHSPRFF
jgi:hypothetical protein